MSTPQAEVYANQPTGTVTAGGTTTSDTAFTVTVANAFPIASTTPVPNTAFHIIDKDAPTEIMTVTAAPGGTGSQSWTVARAQEGTAGVSHAANWTCVQVATAGELNDLKENQSAASGIVTVGNTLTETAIVAWQPPPNDQPAAGVAYRGRVFGTLQTTTATATGGLVVTFNVRWGSATTGTLLASIVTGGTGDAQALVTTMGNSGFMLDVAVIAIDATHLVACIAFATHKVLTQYAGVSASNDGAGAMAGVAVSGSGPLTITAKWATASTLNTLAAAGAIERTQ
jgi:hypothetical protein